MDFLIMDRFKKLLVRKREMSKKIVDVFYKVHPTNGQTFLSFEISNVN